MFLLGTGDKMQVLLNEVAPRPHNSGHYTMDACETSQFEQVLQIALCCCLKTWRMFLEQFGCFNLCSVCTFETRQMIR